MIVGIGGGSASGKSTIAQAIGNTVVSMDDFYEPVENASQTNFDHPNSLDWNRFMNVLGSLANGEGAVVPNYRFEDASRTSFRAVHPTGVVVIEGLWALLDWKQHLPVDYYDHSIYVDMPADVRLARRVRRDVHERGQDAEDVVERYLSDVRPGHYRWVKPTRLNADVVVRGDMDDITPERVGL